jgi:hypothetical protein
MKLMQAKELTKEAMTFLNLFKCLPRIENIWLYLYSLTSLQDRTGTGINLIVNGSADYM